MRQLRYVQALGQRYLGSQEALLKSFAPLFIPPSTHLGLQPGSLDRQFSTEPLERVCFFAGESGPQASANAAWALAAAGGRQESGPRAVLRHLPPAGLSEEASFRTLANEAPGRRRGGQESSGLASLSFLW